MQISHFLAVNCWRRVLSWHTPGHANGHTLRAYWQAHVKYLPPSYLATLLCLKPLGGPHKEFITSHLCKFHLSERTLFAATVRPRMCLQFGSIKIFKLLFFSSKKAGQQQQQQQHKLDLINFCRGEKFRLKSPTDRQLRPPGLSEMLPKVFALGLRAC